MTSIDKEINDYLQSRDETSYTPEDVNIAPFRFTVDEAYTKPSRNNKNKRQKSKPNKYDRYDDYDGY